MSTFKVGDRVTFPIVGDLMVKGVVSGSSTRYGKSCVYVALETSWDRQLPESTVFILGDVEVPEDKVRPVEVKVEVTLTENDWSLMRALVLSHNGGYSNVTQLRMLNALDKGLRLDQ